MGRKPNMGCYNYILTIVYSSDFSEYSHLLPPHDQH
jgi:hypothetical protein